MRLLLIRHGDPDYSRDSLTEKGQREALLLGKRLAGLPIKDICVSPLGRARDTAAPALQALGIRPKVLSWLQEFPVHQFRQSDAGRSHVVWDYYPAERQLHPEWKEEDWYRHEPFTRSDTGMLAEFVFHQMDLLLREYGLIRRGDYYRTDGNHQEHTQVALVCHFGIASVLLSHLLNISAQQLLHGLYLAPTSVTTVCTEEREPGLCQWRCLGVGDVSHLWAAGEPVSYSGFFASEEPY